MSDPTVVPVPDDPLDLSNDPAPSDPIALFHTWFAIARERAGVPNSHAMAVATVDERGQPSARKVLLKGFDERGAVFYTNYNSRKAREAEHTGRVGLLFHWDRLGLQVRIDGRISRVSAEESDAYFATRPRESQAGAHASSQSEPCDHFMTLAKRVMKVLEKYEGQEIPRPEHWGGYRVTLDTMEFWSEQEARIHHRHRYERQDDGSWQISRLYP